MVGVSVSLQYLVVRLEKGLVGKVCGRLIGGVVWVVCGFVFGLYFLEAVVCVDVGSGECGAVVWHGLVGDVEVLGVVG